MLVLNTGNKDWKKAPVVVFLFVQVRFLRSCRPMPGGSSSLLEHRAKLSYNTEKNSSALCPGFVLWWDLQLPEDPSCRAFHPGHLLDHPDLCSPLPPSCLAQGAGGTTTLFMCMPATAWAVNPSTEQLLVALPHKTYPGQCLTATESTEAWAQVNTSAVHVESDLTP